VTTISDFDIFARVARTGNMSAAGREMGISPAVVSKRISLLEERVGARLFQRTTRQLTLTETGEGYFKRVLDILSLVAEAEDFVSRRNTRPRGHLKITAPTSFARLHVAPHLPNFVARYPDIQLDFHLTDNFVDIIREGFDVAIRIGELPDSSLVARKLSPDRRVICAAPSYLEKAGIPKTLGDLDAHNCLSAGAQDLWRLEGPEGQRHIRVKGNIRSNSAELIREALLSGLGLGLKSTWEIGAELQSGALQVVLPKYRGSSKVAIYAVYPSRDFMPAKVNAFIEFLSGHFGVEPYWDKIAEVAAMDATAVLAPAPVKASRPLGPKQSGAKKQGLHTDAH
jgi:DNA-binding transcriptional LysR family regulator